MAKSGVPGAVRRTRWRMSRAELPDALEGQIAELCRDLAVQAKRLRQLQEQADELRVVIHEWSSHSGKEPDGEPTNRGG